MKTLGILALLACGLAALCYLAWRHNYPKP
jgi:hypothetical protein